MFSALISGKMAKPPKVGETKKGKPYCAVSVRAPVAMPGEEGEAESVFVSGLAFGQEAEALAKLDVGDAVALSGNAKLQLWENESGKTYTGLNLMVTGVLSAYQLKKKRGDSSYSEKRPSEKKKPSQWDIYKSAEDFDDDVSF